MNLVHLENIGLEHVSDRHAMRCFGAVTELVVHILVECILGLALARFVDHNVSVWRMSVYD